MYYVITSVVSLVVGFVVGGLVTRKNAKTTTQVVNTANAVGTAVSNGVNTVKAAATKP